MNETEFEPLGINEIDKCATIYRLNPASYIYVCFHCGESFNDSECVLQHIESHFQLVKISVDEIHLEPESNGSRDLTDTIDDNIHILPEPGIKTEMMEIEDTVENVDPERKDLMNSSDSFAGTIINLSETIIKTEAVQNEDSSGDESMLSLEKPSSLHCKLCDTTYPSKLSVRSHMLRFHFKEKSLKCLKCEKSFIRISAFESHLNLHIESGDVDWNCAGDGIWMPPHVEWQESHDNINRTSDVFEIQSAKVNAIPKKKKQIKNKSPLNMNSYTCHKCPETCSTTSNLKDHFKSHHTDEILQINRCKVCDSYFRTEVDLRFHVLEEHFSIKKHKCSTCSFECEQSDKILFEKHLELHLKNKTAAWTNLFEGICNQGNDLTSYVEVTTCNEELFSCELCTEIFYLKSNLDQHTKSEHSGSSNEHEMHCPTCQAIFTKSKFYYAHQHEHQRVGKTITETDINKLNHNFKFYIEQYISNKDESSLNPYKCLTCNYQFNKLYEARRHVRERHVYKKLPQPIKPNLKTKEVRLFACSFCGKKFHLKPGKEIHERTHTGERPFQCEQCGKKFFSHALMTAHKKCHDDTTYPCKICGRVFNVPSGYRRHIKIHRDDRSFKCTVCSKAFNTRIYLTRHMFQHSEKTFKCQFCDNKFNTAIGKRQHERSKHNYEPPN